jgi:hypothetical protein
METKNWKRKETKINENLEAKESEITSVHTFHFEAERKYGSYMEQKEA